MIVLGLAPVAVMLVSGLLWFSDLMYRSGMMFAQPHLCWLSRHWLRRSSPCFLESFMSFPPFTSAMT